MRVVASFVDPALPQLFLEFGLLLLGLGVITRVAQRFGFSAVPFYLLAGLIMGDGGFYGIDPRGILGTNIG